MSKAIPISAILVAAFATILFIVIAATPGYYHAKGDEKISVGAFRSCVPEISVASSRFTGASVSHQIHTSSVSRRLLQSFPGGGFPGGSVPNFPGGGGGSNIPNFPGGGSNIPNFPGGGSNIPNMPNIPGNGGNIPNFPGGTIPGGNIPGGNINICTVQPSICSGGVPQINICTTQPSLCTGGVIDPCKVNPSACTIAGGGGGFSPGNGNGLPAACTGLSVSACSNYCMSNPIACASSGSGSNTNSGNNGPAGSIAVACRGVTTQQCANICLSNPASCGMSINGYTCGNYDVKKDCTGSECDKAQAIRAFLIIGLLAAAATTGLTIFHLLASPADLFYFIGAGLATVSSISSLICMSIVASIISDTSILYTPYYGFGFQVALIVLMGIDAGLIIVSAKYKGNKVVSTHMNKL